MILPTVAGKSVVQGEWETDKGGGVVPYLCLRVRVRQVWLDWYWMRCGTRLGPMRM